MTLGSPNMAVVLQAKLNAGRPRRPNRAQPAGSEARGRGELDAVWGRSYELSASFGVLDATRAMAG
jgi:hypothetical protein